MTWPTHWLKQNHWLQPSSRVEDMRVDDIIRKPLLNLKDELFPDNRESDLIPTLPGHGQSGNNMRIYNPMRIWNWLLKAHQINHVSRKRVEGKEWYVHHPQSCYLNWNLLVFSIRIASVPRTVFRWQRSADCKSHVRAYSHQYFCFQI